MPNVMDIRMKLGFSAWAAERQSIVVSRQYENAVEQGAVSVATLCGDSKFIEPVFFCSALMHPFECICSVTSIRMYTRTDQTGIGTVHKHQY